MENFQSFSSVLDKIKDQKLYSSQIRHCLHEVRTWRAKLPDEELWKSPQNSCFPYMTLSAQSVCKIIWPVLFKETSSNQYVKSISIHYLEKQFKKTKCRTIHFNWNKCKAIFEVRLLTHISRQKKSSPCVRNIFRTYKVHLGDMVGALRPFYEIWLS
jgi:hypothetical protein